MAEQADARDLKSLGGDIVRVRFSSPALGRKLRNQHSPYIKRIDKEKVHCKPRKWIAVIAQLVEQSLSRWEAVGSNPTDRRKRHETWGYWQNQQGRLRVASWNGLNATSLIAWAERCRASAQRDAKVLRQGQSKYRLCIGELPILRFNMLVWRNRQTRQTQNLFMVT